MWSLQKENPRLSVAKVSNIINGNCARCKNKQKIQSNNRHGHVCFSRMCHVSVRKGIHTSQNENGYLYINLYLHTDVPSMPWSNRKGEISAWRCPLVSIHFDVYSLGDISTLTNIWKIETSTATQSGEVKNKFLPDIFREMKGNTIIKAEIVRLEWT